MEINCSVCGIECIKQSNVQKYCPNCRIEVKRKTSKDFCKNLTKQQRRKYNLSYRKRHLEEIRRRDRIRSRERYPKRKEYDKEYRIKNSSKIKKTNKEYYKKNKKLIRQKQREYRKEYLKRDYVKLKYQKQNYLRRALTGDITEDQIKEIYIRDNYNCIYCSNVLDLTLDHIIPLKKGGPSTYDNMVVSCRSCNCSKSDKNVIDWCNSKNINIPLIIKNPRKYLKDVKD